MILASLSLFSCISTCLCLHLELFLFSDGRRFCWVWVAVSLNLCWKIWLIGCKQKCAWWWRFTHPVWHLHLWLFFHCHSLVSGGVTQKSTSIHHVGFSPEKSQNTRVAVEIPLYLMVMGQAPFFLGGSFFWFEKQVPRLTLKHEILLFRYFLTEICNGNFRPNLLTNRSKAKLDQLFFCGYTNLWFVQGQLLLTFYNVVYRNGSFCFLRFCKHLLITSEISSNNSNFVKCPYFSPE